jgi:hypothetical protein
MFNPGYRIPPGSLFARDLYRLRVICAEPASYARQAAGRHPPMFRTPMLRVPLFCVPLLCVPSSRTSGEAVGPASPDFPRDISGDTPERKYFDPIDRAPKRRPNCA